MVLKNSSEGNGVKKGKGGKGSLKCAMSNTWHLKMGNIPHSNDIQTHLSCSASLIKNCDREHIGMI